MFNAPLERIQEDKRGHFDVLRPSARSRGCGVGLTSIAKNKKYRPPDIEERHRMDQCVNARVCRVVITSFLAFLSH